MQRSGHDSGRRDAPAAGPGGSGRVLLFRRRHEHRRDPAVAAVEQAVATARVVAISYVDRTGERSVREVEPAGLVRGTEGWYLVGRCRLRGAGRSFRLDRVSAARVVDEPAPPRVIRGLVPDVPVGCRLDGIGNEANPDPRRCAAVLPVADH